MSMTIQHQSTCRRVSAFREVGLFDDEPCSPPPNFEDLIRPQNHNRQHRPRKRMEPTVDRIDEEDECNSSCDEGYDQLGFPISQRSAILPRRSFRKALLSRAILIALTIVSIIHLTPLIAMRKNVAIFGVAGRPSEPRVASQRHAGEIRKRANSPTDVCKRWSQQSAIVNGTLYLYGGRATTSSDQDSNTWSMQYFLLSQHRYVVSNCF